MAHEPDDVQLTRYLLGECSEDEKTLVEEHYFADDSTFERLCCLEDALIEQRLDGALGGDARVSFDRLHGDGRRRDRMLLTAALRHAALTKPIDRPRTISPGKPRWPGLLAAAVVVLAAGALLVWQNLQLRRSLSEARDERQSLQQQHDADGRRIADLERQAAADARLAPPGTRPASVIAALVLRPGMLRGAQGPREATIDPSAHALRLQLEIDDAIDDTQFRAELRTAAGALLWAGEGLTREAGGGAVAITVPVESIQPGELEVALLSRKAGGAYEETGRYFFNVKR